MSAPNVNPGVNLGAGLEGRAVIVTGAAGGIGRATAALLAECGARVVAVDIDRSAVEDVVGTLAGDGHRPYAADLADTGTHGDLITYAVQECGEIAALAHLAAVMRRRSDLADVTEDDWDQQIDVNLKATFFLCRSVAEHMAVHTAGHMAGDTAEGTGGSIVTFSSQGWWTGGFGGSVVYSASKGGVVSLTRGLARTYGPRGVRVNAVAPGQVETPMLTTDLDDAVRDKMVADTPLRRIADPSEVASVAVFLASRNASFISGATINVSGGFLMY